MNRAHRTHCFAPSPAPAPPRRAELVLSRPDGSPWRLQLSPDAARFIGRYPRVEGIASVGPLLDFAELPAD